MKDLSRREHDNRLEVLAPRYTASVGAVPSAQSLTGLHPHSRSQALAAGVRVAAFRRLTGVSEG